MPSSSTNAVTVYNRLAKDLNPLKTTELGRILATTTVAENTVRIHQKGKNVNEAAIGRYSTTPLYVSNSQSPKKLRPKGKNGKSKFKNGNAHKSTYFEDGYKGFRDAAGRESGFVNLSLSGRQSKEFGIDFVGNSVVVGFLTKRAATIGNAMEKKYGSPIWGLSKKEEGILQRTIDNYVNRTLNGAR